jgi:LuxR family glucitol operon transcriptional activator
MPDSLLTTYVSKVSCYPLAIKWVIGQVAIGKNLDNIVDAIHANTSDISQFCFEQVYHSLTAASKQLLCALSCFDDAPSAGVLKYCVNLTTGEFDDGIQELILVSFVVPEQHQEQDNSLTTCYSLLPLTRGYVREQLDRDVSVRRSP